ncbi:MAG: aldo/keto reductase [Actinomycetota bacterium]|nr:aldo/keto reductase [Actinomycetota bacterium]
MPGCSSLVFGTAQLGSAYGIANTSGRPTHAAALQLLATAKAAGVRAVDTAPSYGEAETIIGSAGVDLPVFTKVGPADDPEQSLQGSLMRLQRASVDILFFHDAASALAGDRRSVDAATALVGSLVSRLGISTYTVEEFREALSDGRFGAIQAPVSVADRRLVDSGLLERAAHEGIDVYARSAFLQGALLMPAGTLPARLRDLEETRAVVVEAARTEGRSVAEVLAVFARDLPGVTAVVVGAETQAQLQANIDALRAPPLSIDTSERLFALAPLSEVVLDPRAWSRP